MQYQTDDGIVAGSIKAAALDPTYAHSSACALMPEQLGGGVGTQLRVYGVDRLRVVDASILPLIPAAHLQAAMYAVAEKAADIIKGLWSDDSLTLYACVNIKVTLLIDIYFN